MGLLPYAARDVLRNRRRSVSSILGVLLAVTFVAGTFIAIDSSARATLDASLAGIPGDFSFSIYTFGPNQVNYSTLEQAVLELGGVVNVSVYRNLGSLAFELRNASGRVVGSYGVSQALAINPDRPMPCRQCTATLLPAFSWAVILSIRERASCWDAGIPRSGIGNEIKRSA